MPRSRSDIAEEICARLELDLDIKPIIEQRIDGLLEITEPYTGGEWKSWVKAPRLAARCRADLAALRPQLDFVTRTVSPGAPPNLDDLDKALKCIESLLGILDPKDPGNPGKRRLPDSRSGIVQIICMHYAYALMLEFKIQPRSSLKNPFYWVAGLFYEAATGERNELGLKRHCDAFLAEFDQRC